MLHLDGGTFVGMMALAIPIVAIIGGITVAIVKMISQNRVVEMAQRERIAAIERGVDPAKLPPPPVVGGSDELASLYLAPRQFALHRAQGYLVGGIVTLAVGVGLMAMLYFLADGDDGKRAWAVGLIPGCVGAALILSSLIVRGSAPAEDRPPRA